MLGKIVCGVLGHAVNRRRVWHDGLEFRTKCKRCGKDLHREDDGWHMIAGDEADDPRRAVDHP